MKIIFILFFSGCLINSLSAQIMLSRQVVGSTGASGKTDGVQIDYTIGEVAVATFSIPGRMLTQGFHQPGMIPSYNGFPVSGFKLYPNPANSFVNVEFYLWIDATFTLSMFNIAGQFISRNTYTYSVGKVVIQLPLMHLSAGTYVIILKVYGQVITEPLVIQ